MDGGQGGSTVAFDVGTFCACVEQVGGETTSARATFDALQAAHAEPQRHYHDASHIDACLRAFEPVRHLAELPAEVESALFFHDAVYDPRSSGNEARSARWAVRALGEAGVASSVCGRVEAMIMATRHHEPATGDEALLVDVDLGILGMPEPVFERYDQGIRREYAHVPEADYRAARAEVLAGFLRRRRIFHTDHFHALLDAPARANLERKIAELRC